jgi:hypothetical protein
MHKISWRGLQALGERGKMGLATIILTFSTTFLVPNICHSIGGMEVTYYPIGWNKREDVAFI